MKKMKKGILNNPTNVAILIISAIAFIVGIFAIGFLWSFLLVGTIDVICFFPAIKRFIKRLIKEIKKKETKEKSKPQKIKKRKEEKVIYEYKVDDEIVSSEEVDEMKKGSKKEKKKSNKKAILVRIFQYFLLFCCVCFIFGCIALGAFAKYIVDNAPEFNPENLYSKEPTTILYSDGSVMATIGLENRSILTYDELPEVLINALIATEDANFFQHNGVDIKRFMVAAFKQLLGQSDAGGASTLTMQLSKNYIVQDLTAKGWQGIVRKFTDIYMSVFKIETTYTKEEILEFYINAGQIGSAYGVEAAAQMYFNKGAKDLNVSEAAILVGMFQAPTRLNPFYYPENAEERRKMVLYYMRRHGYISEEEYNIALKMTVEKMVVGSPNSSNTNDDIEPEAMSAVDTVVAEVQEKTGINPRTTSMTIYTTIDKKMQNHVGNIMVGDTYKWENSKVQAGVAVVDVESGALVAVGGNRDTSGAANMNHATDINYQIGSTAKPLYDYGPAIEYLNWSTGTVIADEKDVTYSDGTEVNNWDGKYKNFINIAESLKLSRNIPALKTFKNVDKANIQKFVTSLGLSPESYLHEAHAIGGYNGESPLSMAAAYAAFANGGYYTEPYSFTKLVYSDTGETYVNNSKTNQVMHDYTAYMISKMLQEAASYGLDTGKYYNVNRVKYAAKTGTTNYDEKDFERFDLPSRAVKDYWVVGYNTEYSIGIWYGYDSIREGHNMLSSLQHARIFQAVAKGIFKNKDDFEKPDSVIEVEIETGNATLMLPSKNTPSKYREKVLFVKGTEPKVVSPRFDTLDAVTNLQGYAENGTVHLSWTGIAQPDAFNTTVLTEQNKSAYETTKELNAYVKSLINTNKKVLGTLGYNIYVQNADGTETLVGWTDQTSYDLTGYYGDVTVVVKSCYSVFTKSASSGVSVTISTGTVAPPTPDPDPTDPTEPVEPEI